MRCPRILALTTLAFFSFVIFPKSSTAQENTDSPGPPAQASTRVRLILVQGNEKTREEIILREMKLEQGEVLDREVLERDRLRIQNLGIFNRVEMDIVPTNTGAIIIVSVSEMWYLFPYPIIFRNERSWSRISLGAGLLHTNFRGRREVIDFSGWLGFNPALRLSYSNPWVFGQKKLYTRISLFGRRVRNRSFTVADSVVNENQLGFKWTVGKRFGLRTYFDTNVGYRRLTLSQAGQGSTLSSSGRDNLVHLGFSFRYDSRDLWEYPHRGIFFTVWATKTGLPDKTINYLRYGVDTRKYIPLGRTTLALRAAANLARGTIPVYEKVHFGFSTRIRGHFRERRTGDHLVVGSAEFRFPIVPITHHDWAPLQDMGQYGANLRFGISGGLFIDTGNVWFRGEEFDSGDFDSGWGAGIHVFLPYNGLVRFEYGFDENWNGQFIVDALVSF